MRDHSELNIYSGKQFVVKDIWFQAMSFTETSSTSAGGHWHCVYRCVLCAEFAEPCTYVFQRDVRSSLLLRLYFCVFVPCAGWLSHAPRQRGCRMVHLAPLCAVSAPPAPAVRPPATTGSVRSDSSGPSMSVWLATAALPVGLLCACSDALRVLQGLEQRHMKVLQRMW